MRANNIFCCVLFCVFLDIGHAAKNLQEFQAQIQANPSLRRMLLEVTGELIGRSIASGNIESPLSALQSPTAGSPFGVKFTSAENIKLIFNVFQNYMNTESVKKQYNEYKEMSVLGALLPRFDVIKIILGIKDDKESFAEDYKDLVVTTLSGKLRGVRSETNGVKYFSWMNIPYAKVTKRFQAPEPVDPWFGIREASEERFICPQILVYLGKPAGKEDCLFLTIHSPSLTKKYIPVIVWVHGGGYKNGAGNTFLFNPYKLLRQGVMVVFFNYRLGPLGFLSTGTRDAPGNAGMKDIVAALKWIKSNIQSFGGDPQSITVYGVSSGASAAEYLTISPMAKGLFDRVVLSGGSVLNDWSLSKDPLKYAFRLGRYMGSNSTHVKDLMRFLRKVSPLDIIGAADKMAKAEDLTTDFLQFVPTVESYIPGVDIFLHDNPENIIRSGQYNHVPSMIGFTDGEGLHLLRNFATDPKFLYSLDRNLEFFLPSELFSCIHKSNRKQRLVDTVKYFYFKGQPIGNQTVQGIVDFTGDVKFLYGIHKSARLKFETTNMPIYYSEFAYDGELGMFKFYNDISVRGVAHADDLGYVLTGPYTKLYEGKNKITRDVSLKVVTLITNFAKYGNPTPVPTKLLPVSWKPIQSTKTYDYLQITDNFVMKVNPHKERYQFWDYLYQNKHIFCQ